MSWFDQVALLGNMLLAMLLGAGTIIHLRSRGQVEGLTTGASLLFVAAVGICVAIHQFLLAIGATLVVFVVLLAGRLYEGKGRGQDNSQHSDSG